MNRQNLQQKQDDGNGFKLPVAKDCPWTRKSNGVVSMSPELVASLAGAVQDRDEWAIVLQGTHSDDWFEVSVTGWRVPEQERTSGHVQISDQDKLQADDVCVIHSHHSMGAFFSSLDKDSINKRYPVSVVIAQDDKSILGFKYQGTGKVILPCGGKGEVPFGIQPTIGPVISQINRVTHEDSNLGDCIKYSDLSTDPYKVVYTSECGLSEPEQIKPAAFGMGSDLFEIVSKLPRERKQVTIFNGNSNKNSFNLEGWVCPDDQGPLYWSIAHPDKGTCLKCNKYYSIPEKETKQETTKSSTERTYTNWKKDDKDDEEWCDECMTLVLGTTGACPNCDAQWCASCIEYHDGVCVRRWE